jgi:hypothetical protein
MDDELNDPRNEGTDLSRRDIESDGPRRTAGSDGLFLLATGLIGESKLSEERVRIGC